MIKWCLHLKFISSGHTMLYRNLELLLRDYTHWTPAEVGFLLEVDTQQSPASTPRTV